jgi:hypothetical protein
MLDPGESGMRERADLRPLAALLLLLGGVATVLLLASLREPDAGKQDDAPPTSAAPLQTDETRFEAAPSASPTPPPSDPPLPPGITIQGRIIDGREHPLEGALVAIVGTETDALTIAEAEVDDAVLWTGTATSEIDGWFKVRAETSAAGLFLVGRVSYRDWPLATIRREILPTTLDEGDALDLGDLQVLPGGTVRGVVLDATSVPLAGVTVSWVRARNIGEHGWNHEGPAGATGDGGGFLLEQVPAEPIRVVARKEGFDPVASDLLEVRSYEIHEVALRLEKAQRLHGRLVIGKGDRDRLGSGDRRLRSRGRPLQGEVIFRALDTRLRLEARTDRRGAFEIDVTPGTTYEVEVNAKGYLDVPEDGSCYVEVPAGGPGPEDVVIHARPAPDLVVEVTEAGAFRGRQHRPAPLDGAEILLRRLDRDEPIPSTLLAGSGKVAGLTDSKGRLRIPEVRWNRTAVFARKEGYAPQIGVSVAYEGERWFGCDVSFSLTRKLPLEVTVLDGNGPAEGARVLLHTALDPELLIEGWPSVPAHAGRTARRKLGSATTCALGRASLPLVREVVTVVAYARDSAIAVSLPLDLRKGAPTDEVTLTLPAPGRIHGIVRSGLGGERGCVVLAVDRRGFTRTAVTRGEGHYSIGRLPPGDYRVTALRDAPRPPSSLRIDSRQIPVGTQEIVLEEGVDRRLDLDLPRQPFGLCGRVQLDFEGPFPFHDSSSRSRSRDTVIVALFSWDEDTASWLPGPTTAADGRRDYSFDTLQTGVHRVVARWSNLGLIPFGDVRIDLREEEGYRRVDFFAQVSPVGITVDRPAVVRKLRLVVPPGDGLWPNTAELEVDEASHLATCLLPVGTYRIVALDNGGEPIGDPEELVVTPGETRFRVQ